MAEITLTSDIGVELIQHVGGDHMVVAAARVSSNGQDALKWADPEYDEETQGLINSLMRHRHGTPFEHGSLTFFVHVPIFVMREWERHRHLSFNEESGRYKQLEPVFWIPRLERKMKVLEKHNPMRPEYGHLDYYVAASSQDAAWTLCYKEYKRYIWEIDHGVAPEVARRLLPVSTYTSAWVTGNPRAWMHFISLRTHEPEASYVSYPQAEIEEAARKVESVFAELWPKTYKAFNKYGRVAP